MEYKMPWIRFYDDRMLWNGWCADYPYFWPGWVGGNDDFKKRGQPFQQIEKLRSTTMLEF